MTPTPSDMETAMSDEGQQLRDLMSAPARQKAAKEKCYEACRAINPDNPVVVAEALPELVERIVEMIEAIDGGAIDSQEIDVGDADIPPHKFHEAWQHHASETLYKLKARP